MVPGYRSGAESGTHEASPGEGQPEEVNRCPDSPRSALITAVVKAIEKVAAKGHLDAETKKLVEDVVAKAK